jgi:hypothetical protein
MIALFILDMRLRLNLNKSAFLIQSFETASVNVATLNAMPIKIQHPANETSDNQTSASIFRTTEK